MNAKFTQHRLDMHLTYFYMCFFVRLAKKFMNHELYFTERANDPLAFEMTLLFSSIELTLGTRLRG